MKTAAVYLRVSTEEQNTENQLPSIEAYAKWKGIEIKEIYSENESAWRQGHQHELARFLNDIRLGRRKYDLLIIWALDRLSRQGTGALIQLVNSIELCKCHVVSIQESWTQDDAGPMKELMVGIYGCFAKIESVRRSERTKAGQARVRKEGKHIGRPKGKKDSKKRHRRRIVVYK
jgi:putative DNA-invertase from lambdoid prophage Rac